jgi:hypothetical protein
MVLGFVVPKRELKNASTVLSVTLPRAFAGDFTEKE